MSITTVTFSLADVKEIRKFVRTNLPDYLNDPDRPDHGDYRQAQELIADHITDLVDTDRSTIRSMVIGYVKAEGEQIQKDALDVFSSEQLSLFPDKMHLYLRAENRRFRLGAATPPELGEVVAFQRIKNRQRYEGAEAKIDRIERLQLRMSADGIRRVDELCIR